MVKSSVRTLVILSLAVWPFELSEAGTFLKIGDLADDSSSIMADAARKLHFGLSENRAYFLEKSESASKVAVIYGYVDNLAACKQIADALRENLGIAFQCHPIY